MATDIKLDQAGGTWLVLEAGAVQMTASDLMLDAAARRRPGGPPMRRALVHDAGDGLTLNFAGDYPGGVTVGGDLRVTGQLRLGAGDALDLPALQRRIDSLEQVVDQSQRRIDALERTLEALTAFAGAAVIPAWSTRTEVEEGDDMRIVSPPASELGLVVEYEIDQLNPQFSHEDVISITPPPGTLVARGSTVRVRINLEG